MSIRPSEKQIAKVEGIREGIEFAEVMRPKWQPIETAPKDGSTVLVFISKRIDIGTFWPNLNKWICNSTVGPFPPTHWMPLPPGPKDVD